MYPAFCSDELNLAGILMYEPVNGVCIIWFLAYYIIISSTWGGYRPDYTRGVQIFEDQNYNYGTLAS